MLKKDLIDNMRFLLSGIPNDLKKFTSCIAIFGSATLPILDTYDDIDIDILIRDDYINEMKNSGLQSLIYTDARELKTYIYDIISKNCDLQGHKLSIGIVSENVYKYKYHVWAYQYNYVITLYGNFNFPKYDMDKLDKWHLAINCLDSIYSHIYNNITKIGYKTLYHSLINIYMIENNSSDFNQFSDEQIKNVNITHNCTEGYEELSKYCLIRLEGIKNNYKMTR